MVGEKESYGKREREREREKEREREGERDLEEHVHNFRLATMSCD